MRPDSIVFAVAGMCFGLILGWVIGVQQVGQRPAAPVATAAAPAGEGTGNARQAPPLDEARVQSLMTVIKNDPKNAGAALQLANTYFDAERYTDAIKWYDESLRIDPSNPDASTDLGVSYYYTGQADRALQQFERSLKLDPRHTKTMLNQGIVLAFGKQDLAGAQAAWKQVVALAPDSPEGQAAQRGLEGIKAAGHAGAAATPGK
ncbi:MAG TPA: tetratricopeptide repeat protein [Candidatus Limnocylindrales bacterium]|nr:tetratricopeptide repeat protein [Candidatus Limnocylindrales bacterium]